MEDESPYLFHPQRDTRRCVVSSQWSQMVKSIFLKHSGKAVSPKSLRSSFVTFLRDSEASPEVLKAAANSMRHQLATADSDCYDARVHDRLNERAVAFAEQVARAHSTAPVPDGWALVQGFPATEFVKGEPAAFSCTLRSGLLCADTVYRWQVVPGLEEGFTWKTPKDVEGKTLTLTLPARCDLPASRFTVTNLLVKSDAPPPPPPETVLMEEADRPVIEEEEDGWRRIEGEWKAVRTEGDAFTVALPDLPRLVAGCEIRFVDASVVEDLCRSVPYHPCAAHAKT